jgi:hypothetical protein
MRIDDFVDSRFVARMGWKRSDEGKIALEMPIHRRVAIVQVEPGTMPPVHLLLLGAGGDFPGALRWGSDSVRAAVASALAELPASPVVEATMTADGDRRLVTAAANGWLALSERFALFPGWSAWSEGRPVPLYRADGVLTALWANAGQRIELRYRPPGFGTGVSFLGAWLAAVGVALAWPRRRVRTNTTASTSQAGSESQVPARKPGVS